MTDFVRFPRTPHLAWLGTGVPRDDKVLPPADARDLLSHVVTVEEKLDGANIGISVDVGQTLRVQNRGAYLSLESAHPQFRPLGQWLSVRHDALLDALSSNLILFGEWCYAKHSIHYTRLPDWFVAFDVYDRMAAQFWSVERRDAFVLDLGLAVVPRLAHGRFDLEGIKSLLGPSRFSDGPSEGLCVRLDVGGYLQGRAKLVRAEFTQAISEHWTRAPIRPNGLAPLASPTAMPIR